MIIDSKTPIEYIEINRYHLFKDGFQWVCLFVAPSNKNFDLIVELINDWDTLHLTTGKRIAFLMSPSSEVLKDNYSTINSIDMPLSSINKNIWMRRKNIAFSSEEHVEKLKDFFNIDDSDIPCIIFIPTIDIYKGKSKTFYILKPIDNNIKNVIHKMNNYLDEYKEELDIVFNNSTEDHNVFHLPCVVANNPAKAKSIFSKIKSNIVFNGKRRFL